MSADSFKICKRAANTGDLVVVIKVHGSPHGCELRKCVGHRSERAASVVGKRQCALDGAQVGECAAQIRQTSVRVDVQIASNGTKVCKRPIQRRHLRALDTDAATDGAQIVE